LSPVTGTDTALKSVNSNATEGRRESLLIIGLLIRTGLMSHAKKIA